MLGRLAWVMASGGSSSADKKKMSFQVASAEKEKWAGKADSIAEMNDMDMLQLQQMMDKKGQLETMISNVMKAGYEGGQAAVQALKAS
jgi:conjugal transfer/entry exclusion protein